MAQHAPQTNETLETANVDQASVHSGLSGSCPTSTVVSNPVCSYLTNLKLHKGVLTNMTTCMPISVVLDGHQHNTHRHQHRRRSRPLFPVKQHSSLKLKQLPLQWSASSNRIHIALSVSNIEASVIDYSQRLKAEPCPAVSGQYALWRTKTVSFSIRQAEPPGVLRHLGF